MSDANFQLNRLNDYAAHLAAQLIWDVNSGDYRVVKSTDLASAATSNVTGSVNANITGTLTTQFTSTSTVSNSNVSGINGTILATNSNRKVFFIQNLGSNALYVLFGTGVITTGFCNMVLGGGLSGVGGTFTDDFGRYTGPVSVSGVSPNYIAWEL